MKSTAKKISIRTPKNKAQTFIEAIGWFGGWIYILTQLWNKQ